MAQPRRIHRLDSDAHANARGSQQPDPINFGAAAMRSLGGFGGHGYGVAGMLGRAVRAYAIYRGANAAAPKRPPVNAPTPGVSSAQAVTRAYQRITGRVNLSPTGAAPAPGSPAPTIGVPGIPPRLASQGYMNLGGMPGGAASAVEGEAEGAAAEGASAGLAGVAGIAGLVTLSLRNLGQAFQQSTAAFLQFGKGLVQGSPSGMIQGGISAVQAQLRGAGGPLVGPILEKALDPLHKFVEFLDVATNSLKNYNAAIAREQGIVEAMSERFKLGLSKVLEPMLVEWGKVEQKILAFMTDLAPVFKPLAEAGAAVLKLAGNIISAMKPLIPLFAELAKTLATLVKALSFLIENSQVGLALKAMAALGGDDEDPDEKRSKDARKKGLSALGFAGSFHALPADRPQIGQRMRVGGDPSIAANAALNATNMLDALLGVSAAGTNATGNRNAGSAAAPPHPLPQNTRHVPQPHLPDIQQHINFTLEQKFQHERAVQEGVMQIRDKILDGFRAARDEAMLTAAMVAGGIEASL